MESVSPEFWARCLDQCRTAWGKPSFRNLWGLTLRSPEYQLRGIEEPLFSSYLPLGKHGQIVWASFAQVNSGMLQPGEEDLPGVTVYSPDSYYDQHPEELREISLACFELKGTVPKDPQLRAVAERLTDEYDSTPRIELPEELSAGRRVFMGSTVFQRKRVPKGYLQGHVLPLVIAPEHSQFNMVPALSIWPQVWKEDWEMVDNVIQRLPCAGCARLVVKQAAKTPYRDPLPAWDWQKQPIHITKRAARVILKIINEDKLTPLLCIRLDHQGARKFEFLEKADSQRYDVFEQQGFKLAILKQQRPKLTRLIMDHIDNASAKGMWFREYED
jgi:Fe-S cluster assembly iron-binding protein IscA